VRNEDMDDEIRCTLCGDSTNLGDLCDCCHRCIDCISEAGHRRLRTVGDEFEFYEERNGKG
jgi:hypothetical protein